MPREKKQAPSAEATVERSDSTERLVAAIEAASAQIVAAIDRVVDQLDALNRVMDDVQQDVQWAIRNDRLRYPEPVVRVTSMPADPTAEDWEINRLKPEDLPPDDEPAPPPPSPAPHAASAPKRIAERLGYRKTGKKRRPLTTRLYFQPELTALVRLVGYRELPVTELRERLKPFIELFGKEKMEAAVEEIVHIDESATPPVARLTEQARKAARALLGTPPSPATTEPHSSPKDGT